MRKLLAILVISTTVACLRQPAPRYVEAPDPEVGDMSCAPPMSIASLLEEMQHGVTPGCER